MLILMAIEAELKLDFVNRLFTTWNMALRALQTAMFALQGIRSRRVLFQSEGRGLEPLYIVAAAAFRAAGALGELALVFVLVAIHALLEGERLFEITVAMAGHTVDGLMFSQQWILGLRVVEALV